MVIQAMQMSSCLQGKVGTFRPWLSIGLAVGIKLATFFSEPVSSYSSCLLNLEKH